MKKRLTAALLAALMVISLFAFTGCKEENAGGEANYVIGEYGDTGGTELPIDKNNTKLTMIGVTSAMNINESAIFTELRKRTGIDLEVISIPVASIQQKSKVLLASKKDMPDIFSHQMSWQEVNDFGMQGAFEEILQHKDELPNMKRIFFDKAKEKLKAQEQKLVDLYTSSTLPVDTIHNNNQMTKKEIKKLINKKINMLLSFYIQPNLD